jgi:hypothetical protein
MGTTLSGNLSVYDFTAETNAAGSAIDLVWQTDAADPAPEQRVGLILRRTRRFPGPGRRGLLQVQASAADLADGTVVYDATAFTFDREETRTELGPNGLARVRRQFRYIGAPPDRILVRTISQSLAADGVTPVAVIVRVTDRVALTAGEINYYTGFVDVGLPALVFSRATQDSAAATGDNGYDLFSQMPRIDQRLDTTTPPPGGALADAGRGQLQRFLDTFSAHASMLHDEVSLLRQLHDPARVDSRLLAPIAQGLGWTLKEYLGEEGQRTEIAFAARVSRSVGTAPNIAALVNRLTGWATQIKEFARNICVSADTTRIETLERIEDLHPAASTHVYMDGSLAASTSFAAWLDNPVGPLPAPPYLSGRSIPPGTVDTTDSLAMFRLRTGVFEDETVYSYDCGKPDGAGGYVKDDTTRYDRGTIGVFIVPLADTDPFVLQEEWQRVRAILSAFLPINVRPIFVLQPDVAVETPYDATIQASDADTSILLEDSADLYTDQPDAITDRIPGWRWLISNRTDLLSVNTAAVPVDTSTRVWHTDITIP